MSDTSFKPHNLPILKPGDGIEIIAPASRTSLTHLMDIKEILSSWQLHCIISENIFGDDLLCANSDSVRFELLKQSLLNPNIQAVICARGGYGCMRLIPSLMTLPPPSLPKLFIGMSDITALHLFLQQHWQWPVLHAALASDKFSAQSIRALQSIIFAEVPKIEFSGIPLNAAAKQKKELLTSITGGNLCLIQASIGTTWQMEAEEKIIFLEEVGERGYRIDRMLEQLQQSALLHNAQAIVFGDFIGGNEPNGTSLVLPVLQRFAESCVIPVVKIHSVGHGYDNLPLPLGTQAQLMLGDVIKLICYR